MKLLLVHLYGFAIGAACLLLLKSLVIILQHTFRRRSLPMRLMPLPVRGDFSSLRVR